MGANGVTDTWEFQNKSICKPWRRHEAMCSLCIGVIGSLIIESIYSHSHLYPHHYSTKSDPLMNLRHK